MIFLENYNLAYPEFETQPEELMVYLVRKVTDCDFVASFCKTKGVAVQAGGHIGLWPRQLAKHFAFVHTFEPVAELFECLKVNANAPNIIARQWALGSSVRDVQFEARAGGRGKVVSSPATKVQQITIDSMNLVRCDLIYLDVERYEFEVLAGAQQTIKNFRPVVVLEVLKGQEAATNNWMDKNGYVSAAKIHNDIVLTPA